MILYLDTSVLLKLYIEEEGSALIKQQTEIADELCTCILAYAELRAACAKAMRMKRVARPAYLSLLKDIERDWGAFSLVGVDAALVRRAGALAEPHALRGYDSLHLAAAERVFTTSGRSAAFCFAASDEVLNKAAKSLGMGLLA